LCDIRCLPADSEHRLIVMFKLLSSESAHHMETGAGQRNADLVHSTAYASDPRSIAINLVLLVNSINAVDLGVVTG
jgi:hypothetical protein